MRVKPYAFPSSLHHWITYLEVSENIEKFNTLDDFVFPFFSSLWLEVFYANSTYNDVNECKFEIKILVDVW